MKSTKIRGKCKFCTELSIRDKLFSTARECVKPERIFCMNTPGGYPLNYCPECGRKLVEK